MGTPPGAHLLDMLGETSDELERIALVHALQAVGVSSQCSPKFHKQMARALQRAGSLMRED